MSGAGAASLSVGVRVAIVWWVALLCGCGPVQSPTGAFESSHPQLIAFARPDLAASDQPGSSEALASLELALSDTVRCLEMDELGVSVVYQSQVEVSHSGETHTFALEGGGQEGVVGIVLVAPDRPPEAVNPEASLGSLQRGLRDAAASYFGKEQCRVQR